ncbi:RagB/SusD family nutrient uptake outer membrane protein [uncultured Bacteroides sp.]|uniref:RagB/SusD family nutrient uptake outer membrane protein n=1 Tax=uncultured Bacteroides sp. TaxID=162156 RepID=UPI0025EE787D|nr:RagB/SusD family nutrient uptake outer membrane protein [uncultured Bacteroides sp.]
MKKYIYILIAGVLTLTGCEDFLNRTPLSELSPENYFTDKAEMANWNAGIYDAFQKALSQKQVLYGDVRSDNVQTTGYAQNWILMNAITPDRDECSWKYFYQCISRCNIGIEKYPTIPNVLETEYAPYMAQCYGMRAYMYFWATRVWGKLPKITSSWNGSLDNIYVKRSSLEEIKELILTDISEALKYFQIKSNGTDKYYLTAAAMHALKTDVYMWYNEHENALAASEYFVNNDNFKLAEGESEWKNIFLSPADSKEVIFTMNWSYVNNGANSGWPGQLGASNTNNGWQISEDIFKEFIDRLRSEEGKDARFWNTVDTVKLYYANSRVPLTAATYSAKDNGIQKCIKYSDVDPDRGYDSENKVYKSHFAVLNTTDCEQKLVMYRLANIMLLRAEALNKLGRGGDALNIVNEIRNRVGYLKDAKTEVDENNKDEVEKVILLERQLELYGEGCRWFDLMRTGHLVEVMDPVYSKRQEDNGVQVTGFGDEGSKYWPINYKEFESNLALEGDQNSPYTER